MVELLGSSGVEAYILSKEGDGSCESKVVMVVNIKVSDG